MVLRQPAPTRGRSPLPEQLPVAVLRGTMDALQHAADDGNLHLWEVTLG